MHLSMRFVRNADGKRSHRRKIRLSSGCMLHGKLAGLHTKGEPHRQCQVPQDAAKNEVWVL